MALTRCVDALSNMCRGPSSASEARRRGRGWNLVRKWRSARSRSLNSRRSGGARRRGGSDLVAQVEVDPVDAQVTSPPPIEPPSLRHLRPCRGPTTCCRRSSTYSSKSNSTRHPRMLLHSRPSLVLRASFLSSAVSGAVRETNIELGPLIDNIKDFSCRSARRVSTLCVRWRGKVSFSRPLRSRGVCGLLF